MSSLKWLLLKTNGQSQVATFLIVPFEQRRGLPSTNSELCMSSNEKKSRSGFGSRRSSNGEQSFHDYGKVFGNAKMG